MPPTRTYKPQRKSDQYSAAGPSKKPSNQSKISSSDSSAVPGVQKIKASLRQTRRLLAKDTLAPDTRVETERRLKALEAELVQAESNKKEKAYAVKYHKIKFFERKKIIRKITQTKSRIASTDESPEDLPELETKLLELRVDLNYILHYPKDQRYISLLPPDTREESTKFSSDSSKTDEMREEIRKSIRARMKGGELSTKPEEEANQLKTSKLAEKTLSKSKGGTTDPLPTAPARPDDDDFFASADESE